MLFSVIIPVYNAQNTLWECLNSVQNQKYTDFEALVIDDGSSDRSRDIAEKFVHKDSRFHYFYQENSGVSCARNFGIAQAKAPYITFLDSDDIYFDTYLQSFAQLLAEYPDYGHYWCAFKETGNGNNGEGRVFCCDAADTISIRSRENIMTLLGGTLVSSVWNKVYRRDIIREMVLLPHLSFGEDELFNFDYFDRNPHTGIVINNTPQYGYFCGTNDSLTTKYRANLYEIYEEMNRSEEAYIAKWLLPENERCRFMKIKFYRFERLLRNTFDKKNVMRMAEKYRFNNAIIRSNDFQECLENMKGEINRLVFAAYRTKKYEIVMFLFRLAEIKSLITGLSLKILCKQ